LDQQIRQSIRQFPEWNYAAVINVRRDNGALSREMPRKQRQGLQQLPKDRHWPAPVGLSTAGQRFNRGSFRGQGPEVVAPENDELRNRLLCG
jgi:hypothetical protein